MAASMKANSGTKDIARSKALQLKGRARKMKFDAARRAGRNPYPVFKDRKAKADSVPKRREGLQDGGIAFCPSESTKK